MNSSLAITVTLIGVFLPFVLILFFAVRAHKKVLARGLQNTIQIFREHHAEAVNENQGKNGLLDLNFIRKNTSIHVYNKYIGTGKSRTLITVAEVVYAEASPLQFKIGKENIFTRIGEKVGIKDSKTGFDFFDQTFRLTTENQSANNSIFDIGLCSFFHERAKDFYGWIEVKNGKMSMVYYGLPGFKVGEKKFRAMMECYFHILEKIRNERNDLV